MSGVSLPEELVASWVRNGIGATSGLSSMRTDLVVVLVEDDDAGGVLGVVGAALALAPEVVGVPEEPCSFWVGHCFVKCFPPHVQHLCCFSFSMPSHEC